MTHAAIAGRVKNTVNEGVMSYFTDPFARQQFQLLYYC